VTQTDDETIMNSEIYSTFWDLFTIFHDANVYHIYLYGSHGSRLYNILSWMHKPFFHYTLTVHIVGLRILPRTMISQVKSNIFI